MATVNWTGIYYGFDFRYMIQNDLATFGPFFATANSVTIIGTMPEIIGTVSDEYRGSFQFAPEDIELGPFADPTGGVINSIIRSEARTVVGTIDGLNITYAEAVAASLTPSRDDDVALFAREFAGNDGLTGGSNNDRLEGFAGDDTLLSFAGNDTLDGGEGVDLLNAGFGADVLYGAAGKDTLLGDAGDDRLDGGAGPDALVGGIGNDSLFGMGDQDTVTGGRGADKLYGGTEKDTFIFVSIKDSTVAKNGRDTIFDFSSRQKDKIDLLAVDANSKKGGNQTFKFIDKQDFHKKAGELQWEKVKGGVYVYGDVTGDGKADFSIFLKGLTKISKGDFFL